jgi:hypothetical protein
MFRKKFRPVYIYSLEHLTLEVLYCLNLFYDIPYFCFVLNLRLFCTSFYTDVVILICHLLSIRLSDSFLEMCSPVKFAHSLSKKSRTVSSWELCIICQISCDDTLSKASEKGKCTLFKAVGLRKDDVHRRLHDECDSLDLIPTDRIQYHRSYYKSYTSK